MVMRPDSRGVRNTVTLDMCGFNFRSEQLRTARLQVDYVRAGSAVKLSNEVVSYRTGGARAALAEVGRAVARCPRGPVASAIQGTGPLTYRIARIRVSGLLPRSIALRMHISGIANGRHVSFTTIVVYQERGDVLSGLYTMGGTIAEQRALAARAARASGTDIRR